MSQGRRKGRSGWHVETFDCKACTSHFSSTDHTLQTWALVHALVKIKSVCLKEHCRHIQLFIGQVLHAVVCHCFLSSISCARGTSTNIFIDQSLGDVVITILEQTVRKDSWQPVVAAHKGVECLLLETRWESGLPVSTSKALEHFCLTTTLHPAITPQQF